PMNAQVAGAHVEQRGGAADLVEEELLGVTESVRRPPEAQREGRDGGGQQLLPPPVVPVNERSAHVAALPGGWDSESGGRTARAAGSAGPGRPRVFAPRLAARSNPRSVAAPGCGAGRGSAHPWRPGGAAPRVPPGSPGGTIPRPS